MPSKGGRIAMLLRNRKRRGLQAHRARERRRNEAALKLQSVIRARYQKKRYREVLRSVMHLESRVRTYLVRSRLCRLKGKATSIQSFVRAYQQKRAFATKKRAALVVQKQTRGHQSRMRLQNSILYESRVVQTPLETEQLVSRSIKIAEIDVWSQMLDPETLRYWYLRRSPGEDAESKWDVPDEFANTFHCGFDFGVNADVFDACTETFRCQADLDRHREQEHRWTCFLCKTVNEWKHFPRCLTCGGGPTEDPVAIFVARLEERKNKRQHILHVAEMRQKNAERIARQRKKAEEAMRKRAIARKERRRREEEKKTKSDDDVSSSKPCSVGLETTKTGGTMQNCAAPNLASTIPSLNDDAATKQAIDNRAREEMNAAITRRQEIAEQLLRAADVSIAPSDGLGTVKVYGGQAVYQGQRKSEKFHGIGALYRLDGAAYVGEWHEGKKHGQGHFWGADGSEYKGAWAFGERSGRGIHKSADGNTYEGDYLRGKRQGMGLLKLSNGDVYRGEFFEGLFAGLGTYTFACGDVYHGNFLKGKRHGKGVIRFANGSSYKGDWVKGYRTGTGVFTDKKGNRWWGSTFFRGKLDGKGQFAGKEGESYVGEYRMGERDGLGTYVFANGDEYEGGWKRDEMAGRGTYVFKALRERYTGQFLHRLRHGRGKYEFNDGAVYDGGWSKGKMNGRGVFAFANGDRYVGQFLANRMHGEGEYQWFSKGSRYVGHFVGSQLSGRGTMTYPSGHVYTGSWEMNRWHGTGILKQVDGTIVEATWEDGSRVRGIMRFNPSSIPETYDGEFDVEGLRSGNGSYTYPDGSRYVGQWHSGSRHGFGCFYDAHGTKRYEGTWEDDKKEGDGKMWLENGAVYEGQFKDGKQNGIGTMLFSDGRLYKGEFKDGYRHGAGEEHSANRVLVYYGKWKRDLRDGHGTSTMYPTKDRKKTVRLRVLRF